MTEAEFRSYVEAFNANDSEGFGRFYADDVVFELGAMKTIIGRENILAFYREVKSRITEVVEPLEVLIGQDRICMYCRTTFEAFEDWPDFEIRPVRAGDNWTVETIALYELAAGRFTHIRGARFKP